MQSKRSESLVVTRTGGSRSRSRGPSQAPRDIGLKDESQRKAAEKILRLTRKVSTKGTVIPYSTLGRFLSHVHWVDLHYFLVKIRVSVRVGIPCLLRNTKLWLLAGVSLSFIRDICVWRPIKPDCCLGLGSALNVSRICCIDLVFTTVRASN